MEDVFHTLKGPSSGQFRDRGSRFLGFAYPVETAEEVKEILLELRKEYHDARHHGYAYRLGPGEGNYRVNDDGEPSNSAGKPILGQIQAFNLTNVLIVVIRYFGGTLLGVGGLIQAYRTAAREAIQSGEIIEKHFEERFEIRFPYPALNEVLKILRDWNATLLVQDYDLTCHIQARIRLGSKEPLMQKLRKVEGVDIQ